MTKYTFIGVDISKDKFDAAIIVDNNQFKQKVFENNKAGCEQFKKWILRFKSPYVCMEATGIYSCLLAEYLSKYKSIVVVVANPAYVRRYAEACGMKNKTDGEDAKVNALFAESQYQKLRPFVPPSNLQKKLRSQFNLLDTLKEQKTVLITNYNKEKDAVCKKVAKSAIKRLETEIKTLMESMKAIIKKDEMLKKSYEFLVSIKGIGDLTAFCILSQLPNIEQFKTAKQLGSFLGLSPSLFESGSSVHKKSRISKKGNARIRKALYMASLSAKKKDGPFYEFAKRREAGGLSPKAVICAVARKLAHIIFGVLKNQTMFNPELAIGPTHQRS